MAYNPQTVSSVGCTEIGWSGAGTPRILLHLAEFRADGATATQESDLIDAIEDVNDEFNKVGKTTAAMGAVQISTAAFTVGTQFLDSTPTLHIGFENDADYEGGELPGPITVTPSSNGGDPDCRYTEAKIRIDKLSQTAWNFGTPGTYYFKTGEQDYSGNPYFRQTYLHELLHSFGLTHADTTFSFLNYGDKPWANRPAADQIRPLPDEIRWLRHRYPGTGARDEIAVFNTWYDENEVADEGAALGKPLCEPSRGQFDPDPFATRCGNQGSATVTVCEGDHLRVRFALANYSTGPVDAYAELFFSKDLVFDGTVDVESPSYTYVNPAAGHSHLYGMVFDVPDLGAPAGTPFFPIIRVVGTTDANGDGTVSGDEVVVDWIPTRGVVNAC